MLPPSSPSLDTPRDWYPQRPKLDTQLWEESYLSTVSSDSGQFGGQWALALQPDPVSLTPAASTLVLVTLPIGTMAVAA